MSNPKRYRLTYSLIAAQQWATTSRERYQEFLQALRREKSELKTPAMLDGIQFEADALAAANGASTASNAAREAAAYLANSAYQVRLQRDLELDGIPFVLVGYADFVKAGEIFDTKRSDRYRVGQYSDSAQAPFYLYMLPEAKRFTYLVDCDDLLYTETYEPDEPAVKRAIRNFLVFIRARALTELYRENWREA